MNFHTIVTKRDRPVHSPSPDIAIKLETLRNFLLLAGLFVVGMGIFREIFITIVGTETIFQGMRHISLDDEQTLSSWYSSGLMCFAAILLAIIARLTYLRHQAYVRSWSILALVFVFLSLDEATSTHELLIEPLRHAYHLTGPFYFSWVIPALVLLPAFGLSYLKFLVSRPYPYGLWFVLAGGIFIGGALGVEMIGGIIVSQYGYSSAAYVTCYCIEESLEIIGMSVFVMALAHYIRSQFADAALSVRSVRVSETK